MNGRRDFVKALAAAPLLGAAVGGPRSAPCGPFGVRAARSGNLMPSAQANLVAAMDGTKSAQQCRATP